MAERRAGRASPETATAFHDERAAQWSDGYRASPHFKRRAIDWKSALGDYVVASDRMLDIGCGSGDLSVIAARLGAVPTCVDGSAAMIAEARRNVSIASPAARFVTADAAALPLIDGEFDIVIASSLLEYLDPLGPALAEIRRVTRTDGLFLFTVPNPRSFYRRLEGISLKLVGRPAYRRFVNPAIYRRDIVADLAHAGFKLIETRLTGLPPKTPDVVAARVERHSLFATMKLVVTRVV